MVTLLKRRGKLIHLESHGLMDRENNIPMRSDVIFRIFLMGVLCLHAAGLIGPGPIRAEGFCCGAHWVRVCQYGTQTIIIHTSESVLRVGRNRLQDRRQAKRLGRSDE